MDSAQLFTNMDGIGSVCKRGRVTVAACVVSGPMPRKTPTKSVPEHLLYSAWRWETLRMCFFREQWNRQQEAYCYGLREMYQRRLERLEVAP